MVGLFCWGECQDGQLGLGGSEELVLTPTPLTGLPSESVVEVACGNRHTLILQRDGSVLSCGSFQYNQLGQNQISTKPGVVMALENQVIRQVCSGGEHSLALNDKGQIFTWGLNDCSQLGREENGDGLSVKIVRWLMDHRVVQVCAGQSHSLVLTDVHAVFAFGDNSCGQLGQGHKNPIPGVIRLDSLTGLPIALIASGGYHNFVLSHSGVLFGWGQNKYGQLGCGDMDDKSWPHQCKSLRSQRVKYICCGLSHSVALTADGGVFTFGAGSAGQLGHSNKENVLFPKKVFELMGSTVTQVACGKMHTLALVPSSGRMYAFGLAASGQIGVGSNNANHLRPAIVKGPWVPVSGSTQFLMRQISIENMSHQVILRIFAGGDHNFIKVCLPQESLRPDDFRETLPPQKMPLSLASVLRELPESSQKLLRACRYLACLNSVFTVTEGDAHHCPSRSNHGLDLDKCSEILSTLGESKKLPCDQELLASFGQLLNTVRVKNNFADIECLRFLLILPFFHLFDNPANFSTFHIDFCHCLLNLDPLPNKVLCAWHQALPLRHFMRLVRVLKRVILYILDMHKADNPSFRMVKERGLVNALEVLKRLNRLSHERVEPLPYTAFYIPELNGKVDIGSDFMNFVQQKRFNHNSPIFSFCEYPFIFDGAAKVTLLNRDAAMQMQVAVQSAANFNLFGGFAIGSPVPVNIANPFLVLEVRRDNIVGDALTHLSMAAPADFKKPLKIKFHLEEAVDEGGVSKEFFLLIFREILDPIYGMFKYYEESRLMWFNFGTFEDPKMFHLIGILCGLAIYNNFLVDLTFPTALFKKLLGRRASHDDIKELDPVVGRNLQEILDYDETVDLFELLSLTFEIQLDCLGIIKKVPLGENPDEPVTVLNREKYVDAYVNYVFHEGCKESYDAFHSGFHKVLGGGCVLEMFEPSELRTMLSGDDHCFDWDVLQKKAKYKGEYWANHPVIQNFWSVFFRDLTEKQKRKFLQFLTGSDKVPIHGMSAIEMTIQPVFGGEEYLPVAHTCYNLLDLPKYSTKEILRQKLTLAIEQTEGFALV